MFYVCRLMLFERILTVGGKETIISIDWFLTSSKLAQLATIKLSLAEVNIRLTEVWLF